MKKGLIVGIVQTKDDAYPHTAASVDRNLTQSWVNSIFFLLCNNDNVTTLQRDNVTEHDQKQRKGVVTTNYAVITNNFVA